MKGKESTTTPPAVNVMTIWQRTSVFGLEQTGRTVLDSARRCCNVLVLSIAEVRQSAEGSQQNVFALPPTVPSQLALQTKHGARGFHRAAFVCECGRQRTKAAVTRVYAIAKRLLAERMQGQDVRR